jgi:hypothetical protein
MGDRNIDDRNTVIEIQKCPETPNPGVATDELLAVARTSQLNASITGSRATTN